MRRYLVNPVGSSSVFPFYIWYSLVSVIQYMRFEVIFFWYIRSLPTFREALPHFQDMPEIDISQARKQAAVTLLAWYREGGGTHSPETSVNYQTALHDIS
jgi:hypothetical protein